MSYSNTLQASLPFITGVSFETDAHAGRLCVRDAGGELRAATEAEIVSAALEVTAQACVRGTALCDPRATQAYLRLRLAELPHEIFGLIHLDNRHRVLAFEVLFRGTINGANVYPRDVVRSVLEKNAAATIFFHNHPSGVPTPSPSDELITRRLKEALALVEVRVLDHIVVGAEGCESFAERGLL